MSKNRTAILTGLLAGALCAVSAKFGVMLQLDAAWFKVLADAGLEGPLADLPEWVAPTAACLAGIGGAFFHMHYPRAGGTLAVLLAGWVEIFLGSAVLGLYGKALAPYPPAVALGLGSIFAAIAARTSSARRFQRLAGAFGDAISPATLASLQKAHLDPAAPRAVEVGFLICRACNLRPMLDALGPEESARALRIVLGRAADAARKAGGVVVQCGPTGFDAICGLVPSDKGPGPATARFLLELVEGVREWNAECARLFGHSIDIRIGAEIGPALLFRDGEKGGRVRFASEAGLAAERICAANLEYGSTVAAGPRLQGAASDVIEVRPLDFLPLSEGGMAEEIYEVITQVGTLDANQLMRRDAYWRGVILYREGRFDEAIRAFQEAVVPGSSDPPLAYYLQRAIRARSELPLASAPRTL